MGDYLKKKYSRFYTCTLADLMFSSDTFDSDKILSNIGSPLFCIIINLLTGLMEYHKKLMNFQVFSCQHAISVVPCGYRKGKIAREDETYPFVQSVSST